MELIDMHTHSFFSGHGSGTVAEVAMAARAKGLSTVAFTEHMPLPVEIDKDGTFGMTAKQVPEYLAQVCELCAGEHDAASTAPAGAVTGVHDAASTAPAGADRERTPGLEILCGTEIDWREGAEDYILARLEADRAHLGWTDSGGYDLLLGSVHMLSDAEGNFWEFDYPPNADGWLERGEESVWLRYLQLWCDAANSRVPFTIMTHPDLPKKLGFKPKFDTREYYAQMAETAAKKNLLVEVNTAGLRMPVGEIYPAPALLRAFCDAGVGCTVSSDAHRPVDVGRDIELAYAAMREAGYKHVTVPTARGERRLIALD